MVNTKSLISSQNTIKKIVTISGYGFHTGLFSSLRLKPAEIDTGIVFIRVDINPHVKIKVTPFSIKQVHMKTVLISSEDTNIEISTIEHLMSSIYMFGVDNIYIEIDNEEVPILDGNSYRFFCLLEEAGLHLQKKPRVTKKIRKTIRIEENNKFVQVEASNSLSFQFQTNWIHPFMKSLPNFFIFSPSETSYKYEISKARTFGLLSNLKFLLNNNLAQGASLRNVICISNKGILNENKLSYKNEFIKHKILDAIGDFYVGGNILGNFVCYNSGHVLNNKLLRAILSEENSFSYEYG